MTPAGLARVLAAWALGTVALCATVHAAARIRRSETADPPVVATVWSAGSPVARAVLEHEHDHSALLDEALAASPRAVLRYEAITGKGLVPTFSTFLIGASLVPGLDGIAATLDGRTEYLTPDELLARGAYRDASRLPGIDLAIGADAPLVLGMLAERFATTAVELLRSASLERVRFRQVLVAPRPRSETLTAESMTDDDLLEGARAAGRFLARGVDDDGRYRYLVDAPTNRTLPGYDWPRHAGATYFLAQLASESGDDRSAIASAALRAAGLLRDHVTACGRQRCVADGSTAEIGSTALALLAFAEIVRSGLDEGYGPVVRDLSAFLRAQQRRDGEFMHAYDRDAAHPVDAQYPYFSGEAALALSRSYGLLGDGADLDAARRAVAYLTGPAWSFFGSRYFYGDEHWTCQAVADLSDAAPNPEALGFCLRWVDFWRQLQRGPGETPFDADGAYGVGPLQVPPLTPIASRCEAGIATLDAAERAGLRAPGAESQRAGDGLAQIVSQMKHSLALLVRMQLRCGDDGLRRGLLASPDAVCGALPTSEVDWTLRIDFAQHGGAAFLAWLKRSKKIGVEAPGKLP
jgi:hypothetical protein